MASYALDQKADMLVDDIFDGWLSVPAMGSLFDKRYTPVPTISQYNSKPTDKELAVVQPEALKSERQSQSCVPIFPMVTKN